MAIFTFGIGLTAVLLWSGLSRPEKIQPTSSEVIGVLKPARELDYYREYVKASGQLMVVAGPPASISEPVNLYKGNEDLLEFGCATITVEIDDDRQVSLNSEPMGTLEDTREVATKLSDIFSDRIKMLVFSWSMRSRTDLPDEERAYKTVLIKPAPSLTFAEVERVIEMVKQTGAEPIAIQTRYSEP